MKFIVNVFLIIPIVVQSFIPFLQAEEPHPTVKTHDCSLPLPAKVKKGMGDSFDWNNCTPKDFLSFLQKSDQTSYTVFESHKGWVKEKDLPGLFALLDSTEPCPNVNAAWSSFIDQKRSTVGNEAAWLIVSFSAGKYPPSLNSTHPRLAKDILKFWWPKCLHESGEK